MIQIQSTFKNCKNRYKISKSDFKNLFKQEKSHTFINYKVSICINKILKV